MICPLLSINTMKPGIENECQEYIDCLEEKCMFYLRKSSGIEVYDCSIATLAIYSLPPYRENRH